MILSYLIDLLCDQLPFLAVMSVINPLLYIAVIAAVCISNLDNTFATGRLCINAVASVGILAKCFPGSVYPQFTRMNENEPELESFYRYWHDKNSPSSGNLIIQKYDDCCKTLPSRKPADLAPLERFPCWHIKRDMTILSDGSVPLCRQYLLDSSIGNVFDEGIEKN